MNNATIAEFTASGTGGPNIANAKTHTLYPLIHRNLIQKSEVAT